MKKSMLKEYLKKLAADAENREYDEWLKAIFPITYEEVVGGEEVQIEIDILERKDEYLHLIIEVYGPGFWGAWSPVSKSIIIKSS